EPPVPGAVRITLQAPEILTNPPYCTGGELPCAYWGSNEIHYPNDAAGVAFFTTRATVTKYPVPENCNSFLSPKLPDDPCIFNAKTARSQTIMEKSYIADIENYSVMIEHSVRGKTTSISLRNGMMDGELISANGISIKSWTNKTRTEFTPNANGDILSVKEILDAAGVDLEGPSFAPAAVGESNRSSGVVIVIVIEYKNVPSKDNEIKYKYFPQVINGAEYKVTESIFNNDNSYTIKDRHGIRLVFQQYGQIGEFDFISLLTNLVAALALFKVATFLVELLMLKCLPQKDQYEHFKYEETQDFSEIRKGSDKGSII
ncbi:6088_t:CDS:2, partial [Funneliformis geosporum]